MSDDKHKTQHLTGSSEGGEDMPVRNGGGAGEDEGSTPTEGGDDGVKEEQKPTSK